MNCRTLSARASLRLLLGALLLLGLTGPLPASAALSVPALTGRVMDRAAMLSAEEAARVESAVRELETTTGGQVAVLTVPSLDGDSLEAFTIRVAETWKIGRKGVDDGALLLLVRDSHEIRIEIGYGWEGSVNDARAGDIIRAMTVHFRAGRFGDGLVFAVQQLQTFVTGTAPAGAVAAPAPEPAPAPGWSFLVFCAIWILLAVVFRRRARHRGWTIGSAGTRGGFGGFSGGSFGGGGFSGGGGSFGGGGASGRW